MELNDDLAPIWELFNVLSMGRQRDFGGPLPLPLTEILAGLDLIGVLGEDERRDSVWLLRKMDEAFTKFVAKKSGGTS